MILLPTTSLATSALAQLQRYQRKVDAVASYERRVAEAKRLFGSANRDTNKTFKTVRQTLSRMCSGARRCAYCEDSVADEVEHIWPKDLYPENAFDWENYVYACGPCNGPKNNRFAVFHQGTGEETHVGRGPRDPVVPPPSGDPLLINPRNEDPLDFIRLDLLGTFLLLPMPRLGPTQLRRADYTIEVLRLNKDWLIQAREEAFRNYRARIVEYADRRDDGASTADLRELQRAVGRMGHPTVWREMKRSQSRLPALAEIFARVPEASSWS
jgi:uncharacterized protein (TIGR02646 family)